MFYSAKKGKVYMYYNSKMIIKFDVSCRVMTRKPK